MTSGGTGGASPTETPKSCVDAKSACSQASELLLWIL